jgi:HK97 family phage major capsid protein
MAINKTTDFFVPEILADAVKAAFTGKMALYGSGAAATSLTMPKSGRASVGTTIKVPYFTSLGEFEDLVNDGDALTPATQTSSQTSATVKHSGKAFELTQWAEWAAAGLDPYEEAARQLVEGFFRRLDKELITVASDTTSYSSYVNDVSASGAGTITYDAVIDSRQKWGDEADAIALMVVHSKVFGDMLKVKDAGGRPLLTDINEGGLSKFAGIPVMVSDRINVASSVYSNLLCKRGALAAWVNGNPEVLTDKDILINANIAAVHMYYAVHRYNPMAGATKPGVVILKTK